MAQGKTFVKSNYGVNVLKEVTPNTYIVPTKALCLEKGKGDFPSPEYKKYTCDQMSAYDGDTYDIVTDADSGKVAFSQDIAMPITLGGVEDIMLSCGLVGTVDGADMIYTPVTGSTTRCSMDIVGLRKKLKTKGNAGNLSIVMVPGEMVRMNISMEGTLEGDVIELAAADANNIIPRNQLDASNVLWVKSTCGVLINGGQMWISKAELDLGVEITTSDDFCGKIMRITGRKTTLKLTIKNTEENETPVSDLRDGVTYNLHIPLQNSEGVTKCEIDMAKAIVDNDDTKDESGFLETERTFVGLSTVGDDNFSIKMIA